jgi:fatty-acyl-CoA synthase
MPQIPHASPPVAMPLADVLLSGRDAHPDALALILPDMRLTYATLAERAWSMAQSLVGMGVQPGDRVGVMMLNCADFVAAMFGIAMTGAVFVPINARYRAVELRHLVVDAELTLLLTNDIGQEHADFAQIICDAFPSLTGAADPFCLALKDAPALRAVVRLGQGARCGFVGGAAFRAAAKLCDVERLRTWCAGVPLRNTAAIIYTSGTTSAPRGAMLTHEALVRGWMMTGRRWGVRPGDRFWNPCPLFHIAALGPLIFTLGHGATYITDTFFEAGRGLHQIGAEGATLLYPIYPPITQALLAHPDFIKTDFSAVRVWANVAPPETLRRFQAAMPHAPQITMYGATEGGAVTLGTPDDPLEARLATCGAPLPGNEIRVIDPETGADLPPGALGEIAFRGYNAFSGYYKDPQKTAACLRPDGWAMIGDVGEMDPQGRITFRGRSREMLKVGGENVAPAEIEQYLDSHPAVHLCQVVGIPDPRLGEVPAVFVELRPDAKVTAEDLQAFCRDQIASFKVPRIVRFVTQWPMSVTKIQRGKLREDLIAELGL